MTHRCRRGGVTQAGHQRPAWHPSGAASTAPEWRRSCSRRSGRPKGFAGLAIGLTLTLIHLISIPISNTSVNPARSTGVAFVNANGAPAQLWVFWLAPLIGAAIAGIAYPYLFGRHEELADRPVRDDALEADDDSGPPPSGAALIR